MSVPVRVDQLRDRWWSPKLGAPGEIVTDLDDVAQCLAIIFTTPKGSDPHRPTFGCDAPDLIDLPTNLIAERLPSALIEATTLWEPRAEITGRPVRIDGAHVTYAVLWRLRAGGAVQRLEGAIGGRAA